MLKLLLAGVLAIYMIVPEVAVFAMRGEWPPDGFGLRGCCRPCGAFYIPNWVETTAMLGLLGGLTYFGVREIGKK